MAQLAITLPPFSPDYSGVCSALFELGGLIVIHDASGCTGNYTGYDEPRWYDSKKMIYCSRLREIDAIMGDDEKLINKIEEALKEFTPNFIVVLGSPVPMLVGLDMEGLAIEIENRTGIKTIGFDTTGLDLYDKGIELAYSKILERFVDDKHICKKDKQVNLLGLSPLDYGINDNDEDIRNYLKNLGYQVGVSLSMGIDFKDLNKLLDASLNIVVSKSGLSIAKVLYEKYDIPYIVGIPNNTGNIFKTKLDNNYEKISNKKQDVLIIHDFVIANSIREEASNKEDIVVASITNIDQEYCLACDCVLKSEDDFINIVNSGFKTIIADPLIKELIVDDNVNFISLPWLAISSRLYWDSYPKFIEFKI